MDQTYSYRAQLQILQGGYQGETKGVSPEDTSWHTGVPGQSYGSQSYQYYYTDSNTPSIGSPWPGGGTTTSDLKNQNSAQVVIYATDSWSATFDDSNNLIVTVTTTISQVMRANLLGNPNLVGNYTRDIKIGKTRNGPWAFAINGDALSPAHQITGALNLGTQTITIPPGGSAARGSFYIYSHTTGFPEAEEYTDEMEAGMFFRNDAPLDYRPGATWTGSSWQSHNRSGGAADIWTGSNWQTMRTSEGGTGTGNPPLYFNGGFKNQYKVGIGG